MRFSPYLSQAQYFCDELLDLLPDQERSDAGDLFDRCEYDPLVNIPPNEAQTLLVFLGKPPSQKQAQFQKMTGEERLMFWLLARYLALAAVDALTIACTAELHLGAGYRTMFRAIAQGVHPHPHLISKDELLWRKIR